MKSNGAVGVVRVALPRRLMLAAPHPSSRVTLIVYTNVDPPELPHPLGRANQPQGRTN